MTDVQERMAHLILLLNDARKRYYSSTKDGPVMSDIVYDRLFTELMMLETSSGVILPNSPTNSVGFAPQGVDKMPHSRPILSLKDTKNVDELLHFLGEQEGVLSWKLDGISVILYYDNGRLSNALTRGDGVVGKVIFNNAIKMRGIPLDLPHKGHLVVRGEGCVSLSDFEQLKLTKEGERYSNPRSLAAGVINTSKASNGLLKHVSFVAHSVVESDLELVRAFTKRTEQLLYLRNLGFRVVEHNTVLNFQLKREIERYTSEAITYDFPVDGLVLSLDDISYGNSLGSTARFPRHSMAFKWPDISEKTKVTGMKWSVSDTGLITPVVIFEPVSLEGTTVKQASLHNLKYFEDLAIGKGDILEVFKANKIVPEVADNYTRSGTEEPPQRCPVCGGETCVIETNRTRKLYCRETLKE